jgi:hypothetical protein
VPDSCLQSVQQLISESQIYEPSVQVAASQLHKAFIQALQRMNLLENRELIMECATFDAFLRNKFDSSVGDVALIECARRLEELGIRSMLSDDKLLRELSGVLKFSEIDDRPANWKQICPLSADQISMFESPDDLLDAKNRLHKLGSREPILLSQDPVGEYRLIVTLANLISSSKFDVSLGFYVI